jgi:hypothetical protein
MNYWLLACVSSLSAFAAFTIAGAVVTRLASAILAPRFERVPAIWRSRLLFAIRTLPIAAAAIVAFAIALPIFLWFEEHGTVEPVNRTLATLALAGAVLLGRAMWRAGSAWRATAAFVAAWQRRGRRVEGLAPVPCYAVEDAFPTVAVAGILRPRLFIAERVLREFSAEEVTAMVAHECAHVAARDNVKRLLLRAFPNLSGLPWIERDWAEAAEEAADARVAALHPRARLHLAQALVHVARLATPSAPQLVSAFYAGGSIESRVRRLVDPAPAAAPPRWPRIAVPVAGVLLGAAIVLAAPSLHALMEQAVRLLP